MNTTETRYRAWLALLGLFLLAGLFAAIELSQEGHGLFNANDVILWTLPLGMYLFLALCSSGLAILSSLPGIFGLTSLAPYARRLSFLALSTLFGGFLAIALEIGSPRHMIYFILSPNPASPIWWMAVLYAAEMVFLAVKLRCLHAGNKESGLSRAAGTLSFLAAIAAPMVLGAVFGITESRAVLFGPALSVFYLVMALFSGTALFMLYSLLCPWLEGSKGASALAMPVAFHRIFVNSAGALTVLMILKTAVEASSVIPEISLAHTFNPPYGTLLGFPAEAVVGLFAPFVLLQVPTVQARTGGRLATALLAWVGSLAIQMQILINGQRIPVGPKAEQYPGILTWTPSLWEWLVALFALAVMLLLYTLGERYFNLKPTG